MPPSSTEHSAVGFNSTAGRPVSAVLEADLREWVRRHQIIIWLDVDGHYSQFVDRLKGSSTDRRLGYEVRALRGSFLELTMSLEGIASGSAKAPLVVHVPGFTEETIKTTPLLELYAAGVRYRKSLETLVNEAAAGKAKPDELAQFKALGHLSLEAADTWLEALLRDDQGGTAARIRAMGPTALMDELLSGERGTSLFGLPDSASTLLEPLSAWLGSPDAWWEKTLHVATAGSSDVAFAAAGWALCVEYVDDLRRDPVCETLADMRGLPAPLVENCRRMAAHLREHHKHFYRHTAQEMELLLTEEIEAARAEDLGSIDTFRFEEDKVLQAALSALGMERWDAAADWARPRADPAPGEGSLWVGDDPFRHSAWQLIHDAARLGLAIAKAGKVTALRGGLEDAVAAYVERGAAVDEAHRVLEQRRTTLLLPQLPHFEILRARLDEMRQVWRRWADEWARGFSDLCRSEGFLPPPALQQRTLFDDVVQPMTRESGLTAYFLVDAFRYEMGAALQRLIGQHPATTVRLGARLAELPTVTEVGMNVLAPVASGGRLHPSFSPKEENKIIGFSTGEFRVHGPETRRKAIHDRVGGSACPWLSLDEVLTRDQTSLKQALAKARLLIVHSMEIDEAGENGVGPAFFDTVLQRLRGAWSILREVNVRRFVFTGDHGFLLLDDSDGHVQTHGRRIDPKRRYSLTPTAADEDHKVRVPLAELGYDCADKHLVFPESTAVFDRGKKASSFVHGGNSLQERVIPVLTVVHRAAAGGSSLSYAITATAREAVAGMHCLEVKVDVAGQGGLDFGGLKEIALGLRVPGSPEIEVELCQARGKARVTGTVVQAQVGERFELFFRLLGPSEVRAQIEIHQFGALDVASYTPDARFEVQASLNHSAAREQAGPGPERQPDSWLDALPEGGVRDVFRHLEVHGMVTEDEVARMLGGPRAVRRFSRQFEELCRKAPFAARIDVISGVKRYVREGGE